MDVDLLLVGSPLEDLEDTDSGAVRRFLRDGNSWFEDGLLGMSGSAFRDRFGSAVATADGWVVSGAPRVDGGARDTGRAAVHKATFTLAATPGQVKAGDLLHLEVYCGQPGTPTLLLAAGVNGLPTFQPLLMLPFGADHRLSLKVTVPSGLSGLDVDLQSLRRGANNHLLATNIATVQFQ